MSDLKKLIEDTRDIRRLADSGKLQFPVRSLINLCERWLALMDEAGKQKPVWDLGAVGGQSSDCKPEAPKPHYEQEPKWEPGMWAEYRSAIRRNVFQVDKVEGMLLYDDCGNWYAMSGCHHVPSPKETRAVETSEDPFQGPQWDAIRTRHIVRPSHWQMADCIADLMELLRMRGEE